MAIPYMILENGGYAYNIWSNLIGKPPDLKPLLVFFRVQTDLRKFKACFCPTWRILSTKYLDRNTATTVASTATRRLKPRMRKDTRNNKQNFVSSPGLAYVLIRIRRQRMPWTTNEILLGLSQAFIVELKSTHFT